MQINEQQIQRFRETLLDWHARHPRPLPWKQTQDPYLIWLSEIILQQTRVEQGLPYYERFATSYPTVFDLAAAPDDEVFKLWEGLGYYSRARNLISAARQIARERAGVFPDSYEEILQLKGVGPYTAAAIASFAFDLPYAVVDGNVYRVLARYFGLTDPIDSTAGKKKFAAIARQLIHPQQPGAFNQAIMNFGATQCTPQNPGCPHCPFAETCHAWQNQQVRQLPVKARKQQKRTRYFLYLVIRTETAAFIRKRSEKDIWQNLYEFPLIELDAPLAELDPIRDTVSWQAIFGTEEPAINRLSPPYRQTLSHQKIVARFLELSLRRTLPSAPQQGLITVAPSEIKAYAFPRIIDCYLRDNSLYLNLW